MIPGAKIGMKCPKIVLLKTTFENVEENLLLDTPINFNNVI